MAVKAGTTRAAKSILGAAGTRAKAVQAAKRLAKKPGVKTVLLGPGKVITPKPVTHSRMTYIKALLNWLYYDLDKFKKAIVALHTKKPIPAALQKLIKPYRHAILKCAKAYPVNKDGKVRNKGKQLVMKLHSEMMDFDEKYSKYRISNKGKRGMAVSQPVHKVICELNNGVVWFVNQHDMIFSSVRTRHWLPPIPTGKELADFVKKEASVLKKSMPNRPKNWALRKFFEVETKKYQQTKNTTRPIPYKIFDKLLNIHNIANPNQTPLKVSAKGYGKLVKEWKRGELFNLA